jgi:anaerobic selenocysteine-containing dehydrogenase
MKKMILALAMAGTLAAGTLSVPTTADARCYGCAVGAGVAAGVIGGAIVGSAIANSGPHYYAPAPGYVVYEGYGAPYPTACPGGYWARRPLHDGYGNFVGRSRPRFICP